MSGRGAEDLAAQAAEAVRRVVTDAEARAEEIVREAEAEAAQTMKRAEAEAAQIRERAEGDAREQIDAARRALDELGGSLAAAVSAATLSPDSSEAPESQPESEPAPEPEQAPEEEPAAPTGNGGDAERLLAMKLAVEGKDPAAIEAELIERFGPGDRSALLRDVISRATR